MPSCSVMSNSATPWTVAHQAPLSMGILQARILEWVAMLSSRGSPYWNIYHKLNDLKQISHLAIPEFKRLNLIELKRGCQQDGIPSGNNRKLFLLQWHLLPLASVLFLPSSQPGPSGQVLLRRPPPCSLFCLPFSLLRSSVITLSLPLSVWATTAKYQRVGGL